MSWFKRIRSGILTSTEEKKETPEGLWHKCSACKFISRTEEHAEHLFVCQNCGFHDRIGSEEYFSIFFDNNKYKLLNPNIISGDPLQFTDSKKYTDRVKQVIANTGLKDAIETAVGKINGKETVIACMDFDFIGGSMGSVVGEKIARGIDYALKKKTPFIIISKSGGARMMEGAFSLMQMAKTSAKLTQLSKAKLPYISILTNPTTGGVTASYAMLGDLNIAEPNALIGFAGPRVVKETIKRDLPEGFQTSEFVLESGFLDKIVERKKLKEHVSFFLEVMTANTR
ncbi:MAG: acetyl-CoA carboxylase, carboxyltransferase subunit beta [Flavobacteriales bacterium]|nr:acetyl-CoA carboxylase, carboxyltransferase subunit beta [Flavobacteriales bacterium]